MKTEFTKEYMDTHTGCYTETNGRVQKMYEDSGYLYDDITILTPLQIVNMVVPFDHWMWFFTSQCELTDDEFSKLKTDLPPIILPIFQEKYSEIKVDSKSADSAFGDGNDDSSKAARAQFENDTISVCKYVALACIKYKDDTYTNKVKDYLRKFVQTN